jgi:hypothetical protein
LLPSDARITKSSLFLGAQNFLRAAWSFTSIDSFNASKDLPPLSLLQQYDATLVWSSGGATNLTRLGDLLAHYWDGGGAVVLAADANSGGKLSGRFADPAAGYALIDSSLPATWTNTTANATLHKRIATSPLLAGVDRLAAPHNWHSPGGLIDGAIEVASVPSGGWGGGWPLVVLGVKAGRPLVALNMYPVSASASATGWTGDGAAVLGNAVLVSVCAACGAKYSGKLLPSPLTTHTSVHPPPFCTLQTSLHLLHSSHR